MDISIWKLVFLEIIWVNNHKAISFYLTQKYYSVNVSIMNFVILVFLIVMPLSSSYLAISMPMILYILSLQEDDMVSFGLTKIDVLKVA